MIKKENKMDKYLLETLDRISRNSAAYCALYINISKLKPKNRHPRFVKILARLFDGLVGVAMGSFYELSNGDFVILGGKISQERINEAIDNLKKSMKNDPIIHTTEASTFVEVFNFPSGLNSLYMKITDVATQKEIKNDDVVVKKSLENKQVSSVLHKFSTIDFSKIIKRQSVVKILGKQKLKVLSQEFFIAVKDLNAQISTTIDLSADKWLFAYLTESLDKYLLNAMFFSNIKNMPNEISLNLHLSSIFTEEFENFRTNFSDKKSLIIVELALMDIFNNMPLYFKVKEHLSKHGIKVLIDGVRPELLNMLNFKELKPDLIKLFWEPMMEFEPLNPQIVENIKAIKEDNIILAKCQTSQAVKWGLEHGIKSFQGPYIDQVEVSIIKETCPNKANCTNEECLKRKRLINGASRDECKHVDILEKLLEG